MLLMVIPLHFPETPHEGKNTAKHDFQIPRSFSNQYITI